MSGRIFISYRKSDEAGFTGRLYDRLETKFSADRIFMDVASIKPGRDFVRKLEEEVARCDILLAIIGRGWLTAVDDQNKRRLDNPDDWVRVEIGAALKLGKLVIPVLINGAPPLSEEDPPHPLKPLAHLQYAKISHDTFNADTQSVISLIESAFAEIAAEKAREKEALTSQGAQPDGERALTKRMIDQRHRDAIVPRKGLRLVPREPDFPSRLGAGERVFTLDHEEHRGRFLKEILRDTHWGFGFDRVDNEMLAIKFKIDDRNFIDLAPLPATPAAVLAVLSDFVDWPRSLSSSPLSRAKDLFHHFWIQASASGDDTEPASWNSEWFKQDRQKPSVWEDQKSRAERLDALIGGRAVSYQGLTRSGRGRSEFASRHFLVRNIALSSLEFEVQNMGSRKDLILLT